MDLMKVHHEAWIDVGQGKPDEVTNVLYHMELPHKDAKFTEIRDNFVIENYDRQQVMVSRSMKLEWDTEE